MTIDRKWLKGYCKKLRCCMTEEQEKYILLLFATEPDERCIWSEQDICEQIRKILDDTGTSSSANKGGGV